MHGDDIAEDRALVERIAKEVIGQFGGRAENDDLVQSGFVGLLEARSRYDASESTPFPAYAYRRIRGAMIDMLRKRQRLPRAMHEECERERMLEATLEATTEQVAKKPPDGALDASRQISAALARVTVAFVAEVSAKAERHGTEEGLVTQLDASRAHDAAADLPEPHRGVVLGYFWGEQSLAEIGAIHVKSERWARHILQEALDMLRDAFSERTV